MGMSDYQSEIDKTNTTAIIAVIIGVPLVKVWAILIRWLNTI